MTALGQESVLSTRTLSTTSISESLASPQSKIPGLSYFHTPVPRERWNNASQDVDMVDLRRETHDCDDVAPHAPLPESVANSLLFELPREIRERIYALCLTSCDGAPVQWPAMSRSHQIQSQLLRTCKIVHKESVPLLYQHNCMTFHHPSDANMFVRAMSSVAYAQRITSLDLHIKAQDTRLWMPYLTSADDTRGLKSDFPNLRELAVRFRSGRWQHHHPPEINLRNWSDDNRLEELVAGLRSALLPDTIIDPSTISDAELEAAIIQRPALYQSAGSDLEQIRKMVAERKLSRAKTIASHAPKVKVCCMCRVNDIHFNTITNSEAYSLHVAGTPLPSPTPPVREGESFRGFSAVDLQGRVKKLSDPDLGPASFACTPYANKNGILIALEIHRPDPKRDAAERAT